MELRLIIAYSLIALMVVGISTTFIVVRKNIRKRRGQ